MQGLAVLVVIVLCLIILACMFVNAIARRFSNTQKRWNYIVEQIETLLNDENVS